MTTAKIVLHIGAHKTATTHLQRSILAQQEALAGLGIKFYGPPQLRKPHPTVLARFDLPGSKQRLCDPEGQFFEMLGDGHRLVISEENMIGSLMNRYGKVAEPIYPDTFARLNAFGSKVAREGFDVCLGVRQPTTFLNSAYGQHLMSGGSLAPSKFVWKNPPRIVDWADLAERIIAVPGVRKLTVWRYEDYRGVFGQITRALLGQHGGDLVTPIDGIVHPGISQSAAHQISALRNEVSKDDLVAKVRTAFPVSAENPALNGFNAIEHTTSRVGYALQMRKIAAMEDVTLLEA